MKTRYMSYDAAEKDCPDGCHIHALPGIMRLEDYYVIGTNDPCIKQLPQYVGKKRSKFWNACHLIYGESCVLFASVNRAKRVVELIKSGKLTEIDTETVEYLHGHRTPAEYWHKHINPRMEAARVSHTMCDVAGKMGHELRQQIRRQLTQ